MVLECFHRYKQNKKQKQKNPKKQTIPPPYSIHNKLKVYLRFKYKLWNHKNPRRILVGSKISDIFHNIVFFWNISSGKGNKRKKQMGLMKLKCYHTV